MPVDQTLVDANRARDVLDRRVLQAPLVEQAPRGGDDLALALTAHDGASTRRRLLVAVAIGEYN